MPEVVHLARVKQVAVTVEDLDRATAFYADTLGLPLLLKVDRLALLDCAGMRLMLALPEGEFRNHSSILYFHTEDVEGAFASLTERGVEFLGSPHKVAEFGGKEVWMAFFHDSEKNVMALEEERPVGSAAGAGE